MISASWAYANSTAGPSTHGGRLAYGAVGIGDESYGWAEFWLAFREGGDQRITSTGLSLVPLSFLYRRVGLGALLDIGLERRRESDRAVVAGILGVGVEFVVRLSRRWDVVTTVESDYHTTADGSSQARFALRFHHERIPVWKDR
jgi:hypothetical protein